MGTRLFEVIVMLKETVQSNNRLRGSVEALNKETQKYKAEVYVVIGSRENPCM